MKISQVRIDEFTSSVDWLLNTNKELKSIAQWWCCNKRDQEDKQWDQYFSSNMFYGFLPLIPLKRITNNDDRQQQSERPNGTEEKRK